MSAPKSEKNEQKPVVLHVRTPEAYWEIAQHFGHPMVVLTAAEIAGVSGTRIYNLIERGTFTKIMVFGVVNISSLEFEKWLQTRGCNKGGRSKRTEVRASKQQSARNAQTNETEKPVGYPAPVLNASDSDNSACVTGELPA